MRVGKLLSTLTSLSLSADTFPAVVPTAAIIATGTAIQMCCTSEGSPVPYLNGFPAAAASRGQHGIAHRRGEDRCPGYQTTTMALFCTRNGDQDRRDQ